MQIFAAEVPLQVEAPIKYQASVTHIEIRWQAPDDGGSPILDYTLEWDEGRGNDEFYWLA